MLSLLIRTASSRDLMSGHHWVYYIKKTTTTEVLSELPLENESLLSGALVLIRFLY